MRDIIILGTGAFASECTFFIEDNNLKVGDSEKINIIGYIEYDYNIDKYWKRYNLKAPILCNIDSYTPGENEEVLIGIAHIEFRKKMIDILLKKKARFATFIHHSVIKSKYPNIGIGNIIFPHCIVEPNSIIGNFNILATSGYVSHDCVVGDCNFISSLIAGHVKIGSYNSFGIRSSIVPHIEIGNNNIIMAGMVVNKSIKNNSTIFYRYKEQILAIPKQN